MSISRRAVCALAAMGWCLSGGPAAHAAPRVSRAADFAGEPASDEARDVAQWIVRTGDNRGLPFGLVDKKDARIFVFSPQGRLAGATNALLGLARGDHSVPGIGDLPPARIPPADRTTPAGRFVSEPGRNLEGEAVVWFDYDAGLAIHRLRANAAQRLRQQRLQSSEPEAHRVSAGCVVVPVPFYERVIDPMLGRGPGIVYVLPEIRSPRDVFIATEDRPVGE